MYMNSEGTTLATEILREVRASARRWFIAFLVMLGIEIATISGFLWYISLPVDEQVSVENETGNAMYIGNRNALEGGIYNGTDNGEKTESSTP